MDAVPELPTEVLGSCGLVGIGLLDPDEEILALDDDPGMTAGGDQGVAVHGLEGELQGYPVDGFEHRGGGHRRPNHRRCDVVDRHACPYRCHVVGELAGKGIDRGGLEQSDETRGGENRDVTAAKCEGGVGLGHDETRLRGQLGVG